MHAACMHDGMQDGMQDGIHDGMHDGVHDGVHDGMHVSMQIAIFAKLRNWGTVLTWCQADSEAHILYRNPPGTKLHIAIFAKLHN
jgi:hypothetical protein